MSEKTSQVSLKLMKKVIEALESSLEEAKSLKEKVSSDDDIYNALFSYSKALGVAMSMVDEANALVTDIKMQQAMLMNPEAGKAATELLETLGLGQPKAPKTSRSN